jgi:dihydropteroate synthase
MRQTIARAERATWRIAGRTIAIGSRPLIMGILNVTPDSFSDGGRFLEPDAAVARAIEMADEGADLIDVGGESTRPQAVPVDLDEELRRIVPVIGEVRRRLSVPITIDTTKAEVARQALESGADAVNDVSALQRDDRMAEVVAAAGCGLVLMHMQGAPPTMQVAPHYDDVVQEIKQFLLARMECARSAGIAEDQILLDPGIGFGKNFSHNLAILGRLAELSELGRPVCVGVSRKSFIGQIVGRPADDRLIGSVTAAVLAMLQGARVLRVHDVAETRQALAVADTFVKQAMG